MRILKCILEIIHEWNDFHFLALLFTHSHFPFTGQNLWKRYQKTSILQNTTMFEMTKDNTLTCYDGVSKGSCHIQYLYQFHHQEFSYLGRPRQVRDHKKFLFASEVQFFSKYLRKVILLAIYCTVSPQIGTRMRTFTLTIEFRSAWLSMTEVLIALGEKNYNDQ